MAGDHLELRLESEHFSCDRIQVHRVSGREVISTLFAFDVEVVCEDGDDVDVDAMEGAEASIVFDRGGQIVRRVHGMIAEIDDLLDTEVEHRQLRLRIVPRAHRLTLVETQEVFVDATVPEIIQKKLELVGLASGDDFELRLSRAYPKREFVVQYKETDLAFVSRLAEHLGISFFFEHEGERDKLVFTDYASGFLPVPGRATVPFRGRGAKQDVYSIEARTRVIPKSYVMQDYNYRTPLVDLSGSAEAPSGLGGGVVEYGAHVKTVEDAAQLAKVRAEEREARHKVFTGASALPELFAGGTFTLEDHRRLGDQRLLVTAIEHRATQAVGMHGGQGERAYEATFQAIDAALEYRPPRVAPAPRIYGLVTAVVEPMMAGDGSRFAKIDDHGRYTLRFLFDNAEHGQHRPSHPIRMLQPHAGQGYGMHFPLKPGVEVLVAFIDGDPDRPLIVAAVPNPVTPSPVTGKNQMIHRVSTESGIVLTMKDA